MGLYHVNSSGTEEFNYKFAKKRYKGQDTIIEYMKSAVEFGARPEILFDTFSHEAIPYESMVMTDGHFRWSSELLYYVEKYNLILPKEFVEVANKEKKVKIKKEELV